MQLERQYTCLGLIKAGRYKADPLHGEIISLIGKQARVLKPGLVLEGYIQYKLDMGFGQYINVYGHDFIYLSAYGVYNPEDHQVQHLNGNFSDNRLSNLSIEAGRGIAQRNYRRQVRLSNETKETIRQEYAQGSTFIKLAEKYKTSRQTISLVCKGK